MANIGVTLEVDSSQYINGLKKAESATKDFGNTAKAETDKAAAGFNKTENTAQKLGSVMGNLRTVLLGAAFTGLAVSALRSADAINDLSNATQMSIGKVLEFQKAMQYSGGEAENVAKALTTFYASIDEANQGSDKAQESFARLGVSLKDLRTLSEEDLLDKTVKGFRNLTDPIQRQTVLMDVFGKSMRTVDPEELSNKLEQLRGKLGAQEGATKDAADAIDAFENLMSGLKGSIVLALKPFLEFAGVMKDSEVDVRALAGGIQTLAAAYVVLRSAAVGYAVAQAAVGMVSAGAMAGPKGAIAGAVGGIAAATASYLALQALMDKISAPQPGIQGPAAGLGKDATMQQQLDEERRIREGRNRPSGARDREQTIGKELQSQLSTINQLADGYRRAAQSNMDRYTTEVDLLGKTEYEQELIKGTAEIDKKYAEQSAALEEKKKGAKGATLALIQQSIRDLEGLKTSEQDIFEITRQQVFNYKQQQEEIKRITEEIDKQIIRQQELGGIIRGINDQTVDINFEQGLKGVSSMKKEIAKIQESARKAALEAGRAFSAAFEGEDGLTPERAQELADGLAKIAEGYKTIAEKQIAIVEQGRTFTAGWKSAFQEYVDDAFNAAKTAESLFRTATSSMEDMFVNFAKTGKFEFRNFMNTILEELLRSQVRQLIAQLFGAKGGGGGGILSGIGKLMGFANGGIIPTNGPVLVGERGPEVISGASGRVVTPNDQLGGATQVIYNIQAVDAMSFKQMVARDPSFLYAVTEQGRRSAPQTRR